ncbi:hypothetical protein AB1Y20_004403 [Prymnesium parvum]|uniref:Uncharacterized protein n=1 Tax=Prymnesium parvum TaxID=97485 RepID=A0AB34IWA3_PRYPA
MALALCLCTAPPPPGAAAYALPFLSAPRASRTAHRAPYACAGGAAPSPSPLVDAALIETVRRDIWRTSGADTAARLVGEQTEAMSTVLTTLARLEEERAARGERLSPPDEMLHRVIAPHLPLLLLRGFPSLLREALAETRSSSQLAAVRQLNDYMIGVVRQMEDSIGDMQWKQQEKLRDLCAAAMEGGTEQLLEMAEAMRDELNEDFCNYLNYAIEQEETRLKAQGVEPVLSLKRGGALLQPSADAPPPSALATSPFLQPSDEPRGEVAGEMALRTDAPEPSPEDGLPTQQWLLVLHLVRQGTYSLLAKEYDEDVKLIRLIIGLASEEGRKDLTVRSVLEMGEEERKHFIVTVERICGNLSVQRNAQDVEMYYKLLEIKTTIDELFRPHGGVSGFASI